MKVRGIKRGQTIEVFDRLEQIPDGAEVIAELEVTEITPTQNLLLTSAERLARLNQLFGVWQDQPELENIFAEIDQQRHSDLGRTLDSLER